MIGRPVANQEGFEHFGQAAAPFPGGQRAQERGFQHREFRHPEGPQHVFVAVQVYARFPADGGIHLRKKGGGKIGIADAPFVDGGRKAHEVRGDAAADGQKEGAAGGIGLQKPALQRLHRLQGLALFRGFDGQRAAHRKALHERRGHPGGIAVIHEITLRLRLQAGQGVGKGYEHRSGHGCSDYKDSVYSYSNTTLISLYWLVMPVWLRSCDSLRVL